MHNIREMLVNELKEFDDKAKRSSNGKVSQQELEKIHKLTDTIKNIDKIEMLEDDGYSEDGHYMGEGRIYGTSYGDGMTSYARGRGRNARRDSMGRYSREGGYSEENRGGNRGGRGSSGGGRGYSNTGYSYKDKNEMIDCLYDMMEEADSTKDREKIKKFIHELEND